MEPARHTIAEASAVLGISADAVRNRLKRGTLKREKVGRRVYVIMDPTAANTGQAAGQSPANQRPINTANDLAAVVQAKDEEIARLVDQLGHTRSDLERAGEEKSKLLEALQAGQVLQRQSANHLERLHLQLEAPRRGFWQRLLGKGGAASEG
jgi:DNA-binding Lrp family transcriptional regulator